MPNYQLGKIYVLRKTKNNQIFYVGSTVCQLSRRVSEHRQALTKKGIQDLKLYRYINKLGGRDAFYIELYKNYPCNTVEELRRKEGKVMQHLKGKGIKLKNKHIAGRTKAEYEKTDPKRIAYKERNYEVVQCDCGRTYVGLHKKKLHERTAIHKRLMEQKNDD